MKAYHFVGDRLRNNDPIPRDGQKLVYSGAIKLCQSGLHASKQPFDALTYAPGKTLCLVECGGRILESDDKLVCSERTIVARMDAVPVLRLFARQQALSVIHLYPNETDQVVFDYLMTGDERLRAAARAAAWAAAEAAAEATARAAAWAATRTAAWAATRAAAWAAAEAAAEATAEAAEAAAEAAAWAATRTAAAEAAAWTAARKMSNELVYDCFQDYL